MQLDKSCHYHFIGCGGAGMAPLAIIVKEQGYSVSGSDIASNANIKMLQKENISVTIGHSQTNIPKNSQTVVIYSSAISNDNVELEYARSQNIPTYLRGEFLAQIAKNFDTVVAINGSHGKTTVTAMLVHILKEMNMSPGYMIGGKVNSWEKSSSAGNGKIFITEADESDGSHTLLNPDIALFINIEDDHEWGLGGKDKLLENFATCAKKSAFIIAPISQNTEILNFHTNSQFIELNQIDTTPCPSEWGEYQKTNAHFAIEIAKKLGISQNNATCAIKSFPGVSRRMTEHYKNNNKVILEDYAHHPTEVHNALKTIKKNYPKYKLIVIFQPHRYERLKKYIEEFAIELSIADKVLVTDIFAAWTDKYETSSNDLINKLETDAEYLDISDNEKIAQVAKQKNCVIAILGAGDVNKIIPTLLKCNKKS